MNDITQKYENYCKAVNRIEDVATDFDYGNDILRDALIQRFEFTLEICWRLLKRYLADQGIVNINSPKAVLREAYSSNIISNDTVWIDMVEDRNLTSHIYDEKVAIEISEHIVNKYLPLFQKLAVDLKEMI